MTKTLNPINVHPNEIKPGDRHGFKVIAEAGYAGDWAAYRGLTEWSDEEVAGSGDKLDKETAKQLFYAFCMSGLQYRI